MNASNSALMRKLLTDAWWVVDVTDVQTCDANHSSAFSLFFLKMCCILRVANAPAHTSQKNISIAGGQGKMLFLSQRHGTADKLPASQTA